MTDNNLIHPNTATKDELRTLTGVGPALAERIIAARPFSAPEDMLRVTGISPAVLDKFKDRLGFEPASESEHKETLISEAELESILEPDETPETAGFDDIALPAEDDAQFLADPEPDTQPTPIAEPEEESNPGMAKEKPAETATAVNAKTPAYITRSQALWMVLTVSFFSFILAVALTLSILSAMNNGLRFASPGDVRSLQTEVRDLQSGADTLGTDLDALRTRMDNFEALGGRVTTLEDSVETLSTDLTAVSGSVETLTTEVSAVSESVETLREDAGRFQAFLNGLTELLLGLNPEESNE